MNLPDNSNSSPTPLCLFELSHSIFIIPREKVLLPISIDIFTYLCNHRTVISELVVYTIAKIIPPK